MSDEIVVIDNVVSKNYQDAIEAKLFERNFPWYYVPNVSRKTSGEDQISKDTIGLAHNFIDIDKGSMSFVTDSLLPLLYESCSKINATPTQIY